MFFPNVFNSHPAQPPDADGQNEVSATQRIR